VAKVSMSAVRPGSLASAAGLKRGDRIVKVGTQTITSEVDLRKALEGALRLDGASRVVTIEVYRSARSGKAQLYRANRVRLEVTMKSKGGKTYIAGSRRVDLRD
jgi:S1-C subfamily serine protease